VNHGVGIAALASSLVLASVTVVFSVLPMASPRPVCRYRAAVARTRPLNGAEELEPLALRTLHRSRHRIDQYLEPSEDRHPNDR